MYQPFIIVVRTPDLQAANLGKAFESHIAKFRDFQEPCQKGVDDGCLEDVAKRNPVQETQERFEGSFDQTWLVGGTQDLGAQLEYGREFMRHWSFQVPSLYRCHLILREVKDLFWQQSKNGHVVFTDRKAGMTGSNDLIDEGRPIVRPFLLQNGNKNQIEFVQERTFSS